MAETPGEALVLALTARYQVGPRLVRGYLHHWQRSQGEPLETLEDVERLVPPKSEWLDDALSCNRNGRRLAAVLAERLGGREARLADLGCGFGGLLVAAAERGWRVAGAEPDSIRRSFAAANLLDHGLEPREILVQRSDRLLSEPSDVIVSLDLALHVPEIVDGIRRLADTLRPGGLLVVRTANRTSLRLAASGPHSGLLGDVLLGRSDREAMAEAIGADGPTGARHRPTTVVRHQLEQSGFEVERLVIEPWPERPLTAAGDLIAALFEAYGRFSHGDRRRLGAELAGVLDGHLLELVRSAVRELAEVGTDSEGERQFRERYLVDFETLLATKRGKPAPP